MPITDVQWIRGHAQLTTTQIYVTPTADDVVRSVLAHHQRQAAPKPPPQPTRQLLSMTGWQAFTLSVTGIGLGIVFGAASLLVITKVLTSSWTPNVTWPPVVIIIAGVLALTTLSVFTPTSRILSEPDYD